MKTKILTLCVAFTAGVGIGIAGSIWFQPHATIRTIPEPVATAALPAAPAPAAAVVKPSGITQVAAPVAASEIDQPAPTKLIPEDQRAVAQHINASRLGMLADLDAIYAPFYRRLKLSPEQFREMRRVMAERQSLPWVVNSTLQQQGITDPVMSEQILNEQRWLLDDKLRKMLSPAEYDAFVDFDRHSSLYKRTEEMATRLQYLREPLTVEQQDSIVGIIKEVSPEPISPPMYNATKAEWQEYRRKCDLEVQAILQRGGKLLKPSQIQSLAEFFEEKLAPVSALEDAAPAS